MHTINHKLPRQLQKQSLNQFNFKSRPLASLKLPPKIKILSLQFSTDGSQGVIYIQLEEGSFIIKPSLDISDQIFYNQLACMLGMRVPHIQVFTIEDEIHTKIYQAIQSYCLKRDQCLFARLQPRLKHFFYGLIEYFPSIGFDCIGKQRFQCMLNKPEYFHDLGRCIGYDMMVNNNDRVQLIWGQGNIDNILIQVPKYECYDLKQIKRKDNIDIVLGGYVFIDNGGNFGDIKNPSTRQNAILYFKKVAKFLEQALQFIRQPQHPQISNKFKQNTHIVKYINHIQAYTNHQLSTPQILQTIIGMKDSLQMFIHCFKNNKIREILDRVYQKIDGKILYLYQQWIGQLSKINLNYCQLFLEYVEPVLNEHRRILKEKKLFSKKSMEIQQKNQEIIINFVQEQNKKEQIQILTEF